MVWVGVGGRSWLEDWEGYDFLFFSKFLILNFLNVYLFIFERENVHALGQAGRNRERGRHRIRSRHQALSAEPDAWLKLMNCEIMT